MLYNCKGDTMLNLHKSESGRSMLEMIVVIILMAILLMVGLWGFKAAMLSSKVNTMTKDMSSAITERRYQIAQGGTSKPHRLEHKVGSTQMTVENITSGVDKGKFTVLLTMQPQDVCNEIKKYSVFTPEKIEINDSTTNDCVAVNALKFYFDPRKNGNGSGPSPLSGGCDDITPTEHCCDNVYDGKGCLIKRKVGCPAGKECNNNIDNCACCPIGEPTPTGDNIKCYDKVAATAFCPEAWVKKTNGPVDDCHECIDGVYQNTTGYFDDCNRCENGVKVTKTGESCGVCGECQSDGTCNPDKNKGINTYRVKEGGVCTTKTETVCPGYKTDSTCCTGPKPACKKCNPLTNTFDEFEDSNKTVDCGTYCCATGKTCVTGGCSDDKPSDCNACQTFNTTSGKCETDTTQNGQHIQSNGTCCVNGAFAYHPTYCPEGESICTFNGVNYTSGQKIMDCGKCNNGTIEPDGVDACHQCNTANWTLSWIAGKTNWTTCGTQCCENGCDETDNTKCKATNCTLGAQTYTHNDSVGNCGICHNGVIETDTLKVDVCHQCNTANWTLSWIAGKTNWTTCGTQCCENGCDETDNTKCKATNCTLGAQTFKNNDLVGDCGKCVDGSIIQNVDVVIPTCQTCDTTTWNFVNTENGSDIQPTGECCVNGVLGYDATYCPLNCTTCGLGNELSGLAFDAETMIAQNACQCVCNEAAGYHLHKLSDNTYKCLPYCTKNTGIFLLVDRSRSTFGTKGSKHLCDTSGEPCDKINKLLKGLDLSDRNYALYNEETGGCGYNVAMSMLPFGTHATSNYNQWNDIYANPKCDDSSGTYFDKALAHIYGQYCKKDQPIIIMIITDGKIQERKNDMASYMNAMINKCNATIIYVGPDSSDLKKNMNKNVTNFYAYSFDSSVQTWIDKTNDAANDSCVPNHDSKRSPSTSDSSWFCNVLNGTSVGKHSYLRLTKRQCFTCSTGTVKYRPSTSSGYGDVGVCCGAYNNSGSCNSGTWEYN